MLHTDTETETETETETDTERWNIISTKSF